MSDDRFTSEPCPYCGAARVAGPPCCPALADDLERERRDRAAREQAERAQRVSRRRQYMTPEQIEAFVKELEKR